MTGFRSLPRLELADHGSPFDEALILVEGREEETIRIECDGSGALAARLVAYVNAHAEVMRTLMIASEVLARLGAESTAAEIEELSKTIGEAA